jgi:hypothetical protein
MAGSQPKSDTRSTAAGIRSRAQSGASSVSSGATTTVDDGAPKLNGISATASRRRDVLQALSTFRRASAIRPTRTSEAQVTRASFQGDQSKRLPPRASTEAVAVTACHARFRRSGTSPTQLPILDCKETHLSRFRLVFGTSLCETRIPDLRTLFGVTQSVRVFCRL